VCFACVRAKEFKSATQCGLNVIVLPDHIEDVIQFYEKFGYSEELIGLLEQGTGLGNKTHSGIFTDLGIMYAKYQPSRLMDLINQQSNKLNIPRLIVACERCHMWPEAVALHQKYDQWDQAIITMIEHSPSAFKHDIYAQNIIKVTNHDLYYRSITFYLEE
jgi:clathrin heavy chain